MKNVLHNRANTAKQLQQVEQEKKAKYFVNQYILPKANKKAQKGLYSIKLRIPFFKKKYKKYLKDILISKGFKDYDIKINKNFIYLLWLD